jgi:hypothetical protein
MSSAPPPPRILTAKVLYLVLKKTGPVLLLLAMSSKAKNVSARL